MTYDAPHFSGTGMMDASQGEPEDYGSPPAVCFLPPMFLFSSIGYVWENMVI